MGTREGPGQGRGSEASTPSAQHGRYGWIAAAAGGALLSIWMALAVDATESTRHEQLFALWANERSQVLTAQFETIAADVPTFGSFFANSERVTREEFVRFARDWMRRHAGIVRIAWASVAVPAAELFVEPAAQVAFATELAAHPDIVDAFARARASGEPACTRSVTEGVGVDSRIVVHVVAPVAAARSATRDADGFVVITLCPAESIAAALMRTTPVGLEIAVADVSDAASTVVIAQRPSGASPASVRSAADVLTHAAGLRHEATLAFADRTWRVLVDTTPYFARLRRTWLAPSVLGGGVLLTGLLALHLASVAARARLVEKLVHQRTAQLERANTELDEHRALLEQRVTERTRQLADANRELEAFSYSVSHDLRAPLRAIDGFSGLLLAKPETVEKLDGESLRRLGVIRRNVQHMGRLIDDLLAFSKLSRVELTRRDVDMSALVHACLDTLAHEREGRNVVIHVRDLPRCVGDESLLREVWLNLLSNALKYTRHVESAHIDVHHEVVDERTFYVVEDDGVGFDMKYAHKLFGVFQRLHRAEDYPGTGVGLALVQRIVRRHGGDVTASAELGKGATFRFTLDEVFHA